jgi:hypothetical protein
MTDQWCILRTSGSKTVNLAKALREAGYRAWTPTKPYRRIMHKGRKNEQKIDAEAAILPTFVFAHADDLHALASDAKREVSPYPPFSVFHYAGRVPLIAGRDIQSLRDEEARTVAVFTAMQEAESFEQAEAIRIAAIKTESGRRKAMKEAERLQREGLRSQRKEFAVGSEVDVAGMDAMTGVTGVVESSDGATAWVRFGVLAWKVEAWRLSPHGVSVASVLTDIAA